VLHTHASDYAIGAALMQDFGKGLQPIAFLSRTHNGCKNGCKIHTHNKHQSNYDTRDKEMLAIVEALKEWRHYLLGQEVHLYTDHDSLRYLQAGSGHPTPRQIRWLSYTAEFNLKVSHIKGEKIVVADALSRRVHLAAVSVAAVAGDNLKQIRTAYRSDATAQAAAQELRSGQPTRWLYANRLYYLREITRQGEQLARLYVPAVADLRLRLIAEHHDTPISGHLGSDKTIERMHRQFYWPGMNEQIARYVTTCPSCQVMKPRAHRPHGRLFLLPIPAENWEHMGHDLITSLPKSKEGDDCIVTFVDRLSKYAIFVPCKTTITSGVKASHSWLSARCSAPSACRWCSSLTETPASLPSSGKRSSASLALDSTCPPLTTLRQIARQSARTALWKKCFGTLCMIVRRIGSPCCLLCSMLTTLLCTPALATPPFS
jgi:hypothetical protein